MISKILFSRFSSSITNFSRFVHLERNSNYLRIIDGNDKMDFHYIWLKHNCSTVGHSIHPKTGERIVDCALIPATIQPQNVEWLENDKKLKISWSNDHQSFYNLCFLRNHAYGKNRVQQVKPCGKVGDIELIYNAESYPKYLADCYERLKKFGLVVVRERGMDTEEIM